ncbi:MAG TPA: cupin domain-containing protein, partial [Fimbriimonas sp.]
EIGQGGHSTLERHEHAHLVMVIRGCGEVLVGDEVSSIGLHDLVQIPPMTWHQFRATRGEELGFLCIVSQERDRPQRPGEEDLQAMRADAKVAAFLRV